MIWDLHCHFTNFEGRTPDERMANLIRFADRMGIERLMLYLGFPPHPHDPTPEEMTHINDQVIEALTHWHHRAFGFVYLNPNHLDFSLREFDRCVRRGPMVGIKLWIAKRCNAPELDPIIRRAASMNALVFQHTWMKTTGNHPGESTPMDFWPSWPTATRTFPSFAATRAATGSAAFAPYASSGTFPSALAVPTQPAALSRWASANSAPNACSTAATPAAEVSPPNSPRYKARGFPKPTGNSSSAKISSACSGPSSSARGSPHDY